MTCCSSLRRVLSILITTLVFGAVLAIHSLAQKTPDGGALQAVNATRDKTQASDYPWPLFGGTNYRNLVNTTDRNIPDDFHVAGGELKHVKWVAELGSKAYGGPVIADGKVFVGTNNQNPRNKERDTKDGKPIDKGVLMCFRERDGEFLWQAVHDKLPAGRVNDWPLEGICSSPVVEGKRVYYVNNRCEVICADTEGFANGNDGPVTDEPHQGKHDVDIIWRLDMIKELKVFPHNLATCSPLIVGDLLFVITANGVDEGHINIPQPKAPSFIAVEKKTGKVAWTSNLPSARLLEPGANLKELVDKGLVLMHGQWSNPVVVEHQDKPQIVFPGGDGWLYSFEPTTGQLIWKFDCNPKDSVYKLGGKGTRNDFVSTPIFADGKVYIGVGQDPEHDEGVGHLWCVDVGRKGDVSPVDDNFDPKAEVNKNSALVWHYGGMAPKGSDRPYVFGRTLSTCAVQDGLCYAGELAGFVHCLDAKTGKPYWVHDMEASTWSSPYWVDGKVFFGNDAGQLCIFTHGKEYKEPKVIDMEGKIRATPVVANGVLYVMTENKLYAIARK